MATIVRSALQTSPSPYCQYSVISDLRLEDDRRTIPEYAGMNSLHLNRQLTQKRLERLPRFLTIACIASALLWCYFRYITHDYVSSVFSGLGAALSLAFLAVSRHHRFTNNSERWRFLLTNVALTVAVILIFCISYFDAPCNAVSPVAYSCVVLASAHLLGKRGSLIWMSLCVCSLCCLHFALRNTTAYYSGPCYGNDRFLGHTALIAVVYLISLQAEWSFDRYAYRFESMSVDLQEREQSLSLAEEVAKVGHWRWDGRSPVLMLSDEAASICALHGSNSKRHTMDEFLDNFIETDAEKLKKALHSAAQAKCRFEFDLELDHDGDAQFVRCIGFSETRSSRSHYAVFGVLKDETEATYAQKELNHLAEFDQLSGLANRHNFHAQLQESVQRCRSEHSSLTLLMIDLNGFKEINDTMGHASGDEILRDVGDRLGEITREQDTVARLGGDEFTVILNGIGTADEIKRVAGNILRTINEPYLIKGKPVRVGASIGAAIFPDDANEIDELVAYADTAMYEAKARGSGSEIYQAWMTDKIVQRRQIENQLLNSLDRNEFSLEYQPQIHCESGRVTGVEALLRWTHDGQRVAPCDFIPQLESSGLIIEVGNWILNEACRQAKQWYDQDWRTGVSVNLSPIQFRSPSLVDDVIEALESSKLRPELLDIEVTESVLIDGLSMTNAKIQLLKDIGVSISIDDFGTGYSSLSYLKHLPFDRLKIDRAFIKDIPDHDDGTFASTIVLLGHSLGMKVLAEGVETKTQFDFLRNHDCDEIQGYYFGAPGSAAEVEATFRKRNRQPIHDEAPDVRIQTVCGR